MGNTRAFGLFELPAGLAEAGAVLSADGKYRYVLTRAWGPGPVVTWVLLNPSTADAGHDDATVRRLIGYSGAWGMGGLAVVNLYAWRATNPAELLIADDPVGPENSSAVATWISRADRVVVGWGANATGVARHHPAPPVTTIARDAGKDLFCLGTNADGSPRHPCRLAANQQLSPWP